MSREVDLYKDKIEVSLDGRQIFYLFFGGAVIVGLVFVLGVMVGRRVEARGHVERANVPTTVDPLAALDHLEGGNGLSFQGALRGGDTPTSDVERTIAAMGKPDGKTPVAAKLDKKAEPAKVDAKVEEKKTEPKAEAKAEAKIDEKKTEAKIDEKKTDAKKAEAKVEEKRTEAKAEDKKSDVKKSEAKVDDKKTETKTEDKKTEAKVDAKAEDKKTEAKADEKKQRFTLQLSSFQDKNEAQSYLDAIKASGYSAYVTEGEVDGKQFFRVRMGTYKSMDAATEAKAEFEKSAKKTAIITKL